MKCFLVILLLAAAAGAGDKAETLESLLRELRQTRAVTQREKEAARVEQRRTERLIAQRRERLAAEQKRTAAAREKLKQVQATLAAARRTKEALATAAEQRDGWRRKRAGELLALIERQPLLAAAADRKRLQAIAAGSMTGDVAEVNLWNVLLAMAVRGVQTELTEEKISVGRAQLTTAVLRLGAVGCVWLTADGSRAGTGRVVGGKMVWHEVDADLREDIARAFRVARRETPAALVVVPVDGGTGE